MPACISSSEDGRDLSALVPRCARHKRDSRPCLRRFCGRRRCWPQPCRLHMHTLAPAQDPCSRSMFNQGTIHNLSFLNILVSAPVYAIKWLPFFPNAYFHSAHAALTLRMCSFKLQLSCRDVTPFQTTLEQSCTARCNLHLNRGCCAKAMRYALRC